MIQIIQIEVFSRKHNFTIISKKLKNIKKVKSLRGLEKYRKSQEELYPDCRVFLRYKENC